MKNFTPLFRYLLYSLVVTIFDVAIVWVLYRLFHINILIANTVGVFSGFIGHYLLASKSVFNTDYGVLGLIIYFSTFLVGLAMADVLIYLGKYYLFKSIQIDINFFLSKGLSIVVPFFSLYYMRKSLFEIITRHLGGFK
jgi:putative flippase GtrA